MPIGTSDGQYFEDDVEHEHFQFSNSGDGDFTGIINTTARAAPNGLPYQRFRRSENVEDSRGSLRAQLGIPRPQDVLEIALEGIRHPLTPSNQMDRLPPNDLSKQAGIDEIQAEPAAKIEAERQAAYEEFRKIYLPLPSQ